MTSIGAVQLQMCKFPIICNSEPIDAVVQLVNCNHCLKAQGGAKAASAAWRTPVVAVAVVVAVVAAWRASRSCPLSLSASTTVLPASPSRVCVHGSAACEQLATNTSEMAGSIDPLTGPTLLVSPLVHVICRLRACWSGASMAAASRQPRRRSRATPPNYKRARCTSSSRDVPASRALCMRNECEMRGMGHNTLTPGCVCASFSNLNTLTRIQRAGAQRIRRGGGAPARALLFCANQGAGRGRSELSSRES